MRNKIILVLLILFMSFSVNAKELKVKLYDIDHKYSGELVIDVEENNTLDNIIDSIKTKLMDKANINNIYSDSKFKNIFNIDNLSKIDTLYVIKTDIVETKPVYTEEIFKENETIEKNTNIKKEEIDSQFNFKLDKELKLALLVVIGLIILILLIKVFSSMKQNRDLSKKIKDL